MSMQDDYNAAIDFAIDKADDCELFMNAWREGDWETIEREWPEFKISDELRNPAPASVKPESEPSLNIPESTALAIDDIQISFRNKVVTVQLINGHDHAEYSVDFTLLSKSSLYKPGVNNISDELPKQVCDAIEHAFRQCKSMLVRGHK